MNLLQKGAWIEVAGILLLVIAIGCSPTGETATKANNADVEVSNSSVSLADYLRRVPGITVQGSGSNASILVRGIQSVNSTLQPLFVIDKTRAGRSFSRVVSAVDVNDIDNIEVLKGNEASTRYGMQGSAGVILIRTKNS